MRRFTHTFPQRISAFLLCLALLVGLLPTSALAAGTDTGKAIQLGTSGISGYDSTNGYDYIYYGEWNSSPIKWRVLDDQTNTGDDGLFLLSDVLFGTGSRGGVYFDNTRSPYSNAWNGSDAQEWCGTFYSTNLTTQEQSAVLETTKSDSAFTSSTNQIPFAASENILNGDKVFFLSAEEAENSAYGFTDDNARIANYGNSAGYWWLRSPYAHSARCAAGLVPDAGNVYYDVVGDLWAWAARPAFNLNLNSVLFTSAAVGGKTDSAVDSSLTAVKDYASNEWKLTLLDSDRSGFTALATETSATTQAENYSGWTVEVTYSGAQTGSNEYVSAMLVDGSDSVLYYGRVANNSANGKVSITIPDGLAAGNYTLKVFSEQYNGDKMTDYASAFKDIPLTVTDATPPTLAAGDATRTGAATATVKFTSDEAGSYYYAVVESGATEPDVNTSGTGTPCDTTEQTISLDSLTGADAKDIYIVVKDAAGNVSEKLKITIPAIYTLTVNLNGGSGNTTSGQYPAGEVVNIDAGRRSNYRFTGWTTSSGGSFADASSASTTFTMPAGNVTVTAQFAKVVTGVKLDKETLALYTGDSATLTATVEPSDAANQNVTWQSNNANVATVQNGTVTAVGAGETTITVQTQDGNYTATCHVTVTQSTYSISADTTALNFGSVYTGYAQPAAKEVTITNTGNRPQTLTLTASTGSFEVGTLTKTQLAAGEKATFTVQPKAGLAVGTYSENITVSGTGGATVTITASFTVKQYSSGGGTPTKTPSQQAVDKIESSKDGSTVEITLRTGQTTLDKEVFEELAGRDVTLEISLPGGVSWTVNGQDIPENNDLTDLDLGVTLDASTIPVSVINTVTGAVDTIQISLKHDGEFGFTMILSAPLGETNAGYWANLYYYNTRTRALEFQSASKITADGTASFPFSHASDYAIVIDTDSHESVELPFTDVPEGAWYEDAAAYVYKHGLMAGTSATTFAPDVTTSRAMIATILWRMAGSPVVNYAMNYTDVAQGQWCSEAIRWATSEGVVTGYGNGLFGTNDPITREQLATMLWRYAQTEGYDVSIGEDTNILSYTDVAALSEYAIPAMQWAVGAGIINGTGDGSTLTPQGQATRAQAAVMLQRFCEKYVIW